MTYSLLVGPDRLKPSIALGNHAEGILIYCSVRAIGPHPRGYLFLAVCDACQEREGSKLKDWESCESCSMAEAITCSDSLASLQRLLEHTKGYDVLTAYLQALSLDTALQRAGKQYLQSVLENREVLFNSYLRDEMQSTTDRHVATERANSRLRKRLKPFSY